MSRPIRSLTQARGFNPKNHILDIFGGAGGQHACSIARDLGIKEIYIHKYCGILSAYGMGLADVVHESEEPIVGALTQQLVDSLQPRFKELISKNEDALLKSGLKNTQHECFLNLRYSGTDTSLMVL
jgi:5-oxoprolinase (ATP-hydrolysing)